MWFVLGAVVFSASVGCRSQVRASQPSSPSPSTSIREKSESPASAPIQTEKLSRVRLGRTGLSVALPSASEWQMHQSFGHWHQRSRKQTHEELIVRITKTKPAVKYDECRRDVSLAFPRLRHLKAQPVERLWTTTFGLKGRIQVYTLPEGGLLFWGVAVAPRECLSFIYSAASDDQLLQLSAQFLGAILPSLRREKREEIERERAF